MKAIILHNFGGVENFIIKDLPILSIGENEVLVNIKAFSINPVDVKTRIGGSFAKELENDTPIIGMGYLPLVLLPTSTYSTDGKMSIVSH